MRKDIVVTLQSIVTELPPSSNGARMLSSLLGRLALGRMTPYTARNMFLYAKEDSSEYPTEAERAALTLAYEELCHVVAAEHT